MLRTRFPELEPKSFQKQGRKESVGLVLGPVIFLVVVLLPTPVSMMQTASALALPHWAPQFGFGVLIWILTWWITECVPLGLAGLVAPVAFGVSGLVSWHDTLASYADPIIWIFFAGFALAGAFQKWGLDRRIAYWLGSMYKGGNPRVAALFVAGLPVFFLTMTGSITGSTAIVYPMVLAFIAKQQSEKVSSYATATLIFLGQAATAGAMLLLISTPPNLIAKAAVETASPGSTITFLDWFIVGTPQALAGLAISWVAVFAVLRPEVKTVPQTGKQFAEALKGLGRMSREEKYVAVVLFAVIVLWIVPSAVKAWSYSDASLVSIASSLEQFLPEAAPAILGLLALALVRVGGKPLLAWEEELRAIDWNIIFLFGGGLALGLGLDKSGFASWLGRVGAGWAGPSASPFAIFTISALLGFALTYAASNTASAIISTSIAASLALGVGINPIPPILAAGIASSISSALPSTTPPMAIVYSSGKVRMWDMFRTGMVSDILRLALLIATGPFLAGFLCSCRGLA